MSKDTLLESLKRTRKGYKEECKWHMFLLHAYAGTGGFSGKIEQPETGYFGWAAQVYTSAIADLLGSTKRETYLDRFKREDDAKFQSRCDLAHYSNYIEPILDTLLSYIARRDFVKEGADDDSLTEWLEDANGAGITWQTLKREQIDPRSALFGYCPVLFDKPRVTPGQTRAQQTEPDRPRAIPLLPLNLLDYSCDDKGSFNWVKLRIEYTEHEDPLAESVSVQRYQIWYRDRWEQYVIRRDDQGNETIDPKEEGKHDFGMVPLIITHRKQSMEDPTIGVSLVAAPAVKARRLFNLESELDEHLRECAFAFLEIPVDPNAQVPSDGEKVIGSGNALAVPLNATRGHAWITPPPTIAEMYETRMSATISEMLRMGRIDFTRSTGGVESGESRKWRFEQTNNLLVDFASQLARAEEESLKLVGHMLGLSEDKLSQLKVTPPENFGVEDVTTAIDNAIKAAGLPGITPTAEMQITLRALQRLLPNLPSEVMAEIEEELLKKRETRAGEAAMESAIGAVGNEGETEEEPEEEREEGAGNE